MLFLTSNEYLNLTGPIFCEVINNTYVNSRQVLVVKINPPFSGIDYNLGLKAINYLLIIAKYKDSDIKTLSNFPIEVVVFIPDNLEEPLKIERKWSEMLSIGWADLNKDDTKINAY